MTPKKNPTEGIKRSAAKSLTFRVTVIVSDAIITYAITHRYDITIGFVLFTNIASTMLYYFHERIWAHIRWGRNIKNK